MACAMVDDSLAAAWRMRYGASATPPPLPEAARRTLAPFLSHRSVRDFDASRPVPEALVAGLIGAAQSAATSSNLHLFTFISVQDPDRRAAIAALCGNQRQVHNAPWFFAVCLDHHRLRHAAEAAGERAAGLDFAEYYTMGCVDAALAAERLVCAAEGLGLGACYIGALRNDAAGVRELLDLPPGVVGLFGLCLGYPDPQHDTGIKPRPAQACVWMRERYDRGVSMAEYDERMRAHYAGRGQNPDVSWSMRSGRRVDERHLTGRERLKPFLDEQGLDRR